MLAGVDDDVFARVDIYERRIVGITVWNPYHDGEVVEGASK